MPTNDNTRPTVTSSDGIQQLRPHQVRAVADVAGALRVDDRTQYISSCGTGKTRVSQAIAEHLGADRVLRTFPSLALISQTVDDLISGFGPHSLGRIIAVCSKRNLLDPVVRRVESVARVVSHPADLAHLLARPGRTTVLSTLQSLEVLIEAHAHHGLGRWPLIVVDEAHRTVGWEDRTWTAVHNDALVPAVRRLNMTATPKMIVSSRTGDGVVLSMDDAAVFGRVSHRLTYGRARDLGLLARYRLVVPVVTDADIHRAATAQQDPVFLRTGGPGAVSADVLATQIALLRAAAEHGARRMVLYHRTVADARWFSTTLHHAWELLPPGERPVALWAGHVHAQHPPNVRERIVNQLRSDRPGLVVVSNAGLLTEGVNVPDIDATGFLSPGGQIRYVQAFGRAARLPYPGAQKTAMLFVPVFVGPGDTDPAGTVANSSYSTVYGVVRAMAAQDEDLAHYLENMRRNLGRTAENRDNSAHTLPDWFAVTGPEIPPGFVDAIRVCTVRAATASAAEYLGALAEHVADGTDINTVAPGTLSPSGLDIGNWLWNQRSYHSSGKVDPITAAELEEMGIIWDLAGIPWRRFVKELSAFKDENGHANPLQTHVTAGGYKLGATANSYRNRWDSISYDQKKVLTDLGFIAAPMEHYWDVRFEALKELAEKAGHPIVPRTRTAPDDLDLYTWRQSQIILLRTGRMRPDRIKRFCSAGLHLGREEARRNIIMRELVAFREKTGQQWPTDSYVTDDGLALHRAIRRQRKSMLAGHVPRWQIRKLVKLGIMPKNPNSK
ncbi:Helicase associated domain protein [Kitasatospora sp. NPDC092948]|uniref:DEAD/DEAH box helicase n=1 Tax=Kitasatospora sp. NPDC092948 TaxID=3364088 RepID=UPI0037F758A5